MVPSHSPEQSAIAAQLVDELSSYDHDLQDLVQRRWDPELYRSVSDRFDRMQLCADALPGLGTTWTELLISRVELMHALWTVSSPSRLGGKVRSCHAQHGRRIAELRQKACAYLD